MALGKVTSLVGFDHLFQGSPGAKFVPTKLSRYNPDVFRLLHNTIVDKNLRQMRKQLG